jgi:modulator of FtsH protease HflK
MEKNRQKNGLINLMILLIVGIAAFAVARASNSLAGQAMTFYFGLGVMVCFVSWFQMRLEGQERLEKMEFDEMTKSGNSEALFKGQESETFAARRSREQFDKYFVRAFSVVLFLMQGGGAWLLWTWLNKAQTLGVKQPLMAISFMSIFALVLFLLGKFSAGVARLDGERLLQPQSSYLLLSAYLCAAVVLAMVGVVAGYPNFDMYLGRGLVLLLGLMALESAVALLLEIYRPRVKGKVGLLLYESRLIGLLGHPESLLSTAAHALDYQFGFKVSETWVYKSLERTLMWLIPMQVGLLLISSCFVVINPGEKALLERFGRLVQSREILGPGLHVKFPWPIDQIYRYETEQIQTAIVGTKETEEEGHEEATVLWTVSHHKAEEFRLLVASRDTNTVSEASKDAANATNNPSAKKIPPVNLLAASIPIQYRITNILDWAYNHKDSEKLLERAGTRQLVNFLVNADFQEIISTRRFEAGDELRKRIQAEADQLKLGVKILLVGLADIHPPVRVAGSFESVVAARQKGQAEILSAQAYAFRTNSIAASQAITMERNAESQRIRVATEWGSRAALFTNQMPPYKVAPEVYTERAFLQVLQRGSSQAKKVILATTNTQNVIMLNLEEKYRPDLIDITMPADKKK